MHLIINNALFWEQKVLNWRDLEIIKGAGLVLRPTSVDSYFRAGRDNLGAADFDTGLPSEEFEFNSIQFYFFALQEKLWVFVIRTC